jgi:uncharacterized OB-fold protein
MAKQISMVDYLEVDDEGPTLVAHECQACGALYFERRNGCARCGRDTFAPRRLARTGVVKSFTIVHRSAPGVEVPFVSVVVALDGGGVVKATLREVEVDPAYITRDLPVELITYVAGTDSEGTDALAFAFRPRATSLLDGAKGVGSYA